ncbi:MAG: hypothetical protein AAF517_27060 [Planctomycetota bacterium]
MNADSLSRRPFLDWLYSTAVVTMIFVALQLFGALLFDRDYPLEVYEPGLNLLAALIPEGWGVLGNSLLGLGMLLIVAVIYAGIAAAIAVTARRAITRGRVSKSVSS